MNESTVKKTDYKGPFWKDMSDKDRESVSKAIDKDLDELWDIALKACSHPYFFQDY